MLSEWPSSLEFVGTFWQGMHPLSRGSHGLLAAACDSSIHFLDPATGSIADAIDGAHDAAILSMEWAPATIPVGKCSQCCLLCFLWM